MLVFKVSGRCADEDCLVYPLLKFIKEKRPVIICGRQTEAVIYKVFLSRRISSAHSSDLRQSDVRFIDEKEKILREIVKQSIGR